MTTAAFEEKEGLFCRRRIDRFELPAQPGFVSISRAFVYGSFLDRFVNERERLGEELCSRFPIFVMDGFPQLFYFCSEDGLILSVCCVSAKASPPLPYG